MIPVADAELTVVDGGDMCFTTPDWYLLYMMTDWCVGIFVH